MIIELNIETRTNIDMNGIVEALAGVLDIPSFRINATECEHPNIYLVQQNEELDADKDDLYEDISTLEDAMSGARLALRELELDWNEGDSTKKLELLREAISCLE